MTQGDEWTQVGTIGVDAGLCWVGDPCYVVAKDCDQQFESWSEFCDKLDENKTYPRTKSFPYKLGHEGLGVVVSTGFGDGRYPVFVRYKDMGAWGRRVAEVKVVFIDEDEAASEASR